MEPKAKFIGIKLVSAWPAQNEVGGELKEGYRVEYEDNYLSWSPKEVFERAYQPLCALDFSAALYHLKSINRNGAIRRAGWNGTGLCVKLQTPDENSKMSGEYLYIEYPDGWRGPWVASMSDLLSEDWMIVE